MFRAWLEENHETSAELLVGMYKRDSNRPTMTWPESVDEALSFGWIDGVRRSLGETSYCIRFTPRRARSTWSAINVKRIGELIAQGRVRPAGMRAFELRAPEKTGIYAYENRHRAVLDAPSEHRFRRTKNAWAYFAAQAPWYRKTATWWVVSAKKDETKEKRLATLIAASANGEHIDHLKRRPGKGRA
jgi:uncharacterized protein YdeI (YjbR/CyaY-like superfamily)